MIKSSSNQKQTQTVLEKIVETVGSLPLQQKKVAEFVLQNYKDVALMTANTLATKAQTSPTSINRFCVNLGFTGFSDFQNQLKALLQNEWTALDRISGDNQSHGALKHVFKEEAEFLMKSLERLSPKRYEETLDLISKARRLFIVGHQASEAVAVYATYCLGKIRADVSRFNLEQSSVLGKINALCDRDVAIVLAHPRYPLRTIQALQTLKEHDVKIILITHTEASPYAKYADVLLSIPICYHQFSDGLSPLFCLINSLAIDLFERDEKEGKRCLEEFEKTTDFLFVKN